MASDDEQTISELTKCFEQKPSEEFEPPQQVEPRIRRDSSTSDDELSPISELTKCFEQKPSEEFEPPQQVEPRIRRDSSTSDSVTDNELRLVLIGITGSGKSASANTILGEKRFESKLSLTSVTSTCAVKHKTRFGHDIVIIDTPGAFDTEHSQGEITKEIIKCITMSAPGPHAFIMVLQPKRFTPEDQKTIQYFEDVFGKKMFDYLFLLFTRLDDLEEEGTNLDQLLADRPEKLKTLLDKCRQRYVGFNNREKDEEKKRKMAQQLIDMIKSNVRKNGGEYYKSEFMEAAEKEVRKREREIRKTKEEEFKKEREKMVKEFMKKIEKLKEEIEKRDKILKEKGKEEIRKREDREREIRITEENRKLMREEMEREIQIQMEKERRKLEAELEVKVEEIRREARNEVRKEAQAGGRIIDTVGEVVENVVGLVAGGPAGKAAKVAAGLAANTWNYFTGK